MEVFIRQFELFTVVLSRLLALFSFAPGYSGETLTFFQRMALSFFTAVILTPVMPVTAELSNMLRERYFTVLLEQAIIGLFLAFCLQVIFAAFQMAGEFFSVQMGFGINEVFDPMGQVSLPLMGSFKNLIALFVFFVSNAYLEVIRALAYSFERIPFLPQNFWENHVGQESLVDFLFFLSSSMFLIGLKVALPIMGTLLLVSVSIGMISKAAPQMNMLMMGYPLKILVGFLVLMWIAPVAIETMSAQFDILFHHLDELIRRF